MRVLHFQFADCGFSSCRCKYTQLASGKLGSMCTYPDCCCCCFCAMSSSPSSRDIRAPSPSHPVSVVHQHQPDIRHRHQHQHQHQHHHHRQQVCQFSGSPDSNDWETRPWRAESWWNPPRRPSSRRCRPLVYHSSVPFCWQASPLVAVPAAVALVRLQLTPQWSGPFAPGADSVAIRILSGLPFGCCPMYCTPLAF